MGDRELTELWTCPRCGARFVTPNTWHGCGEYTVDGFFEGRPARLKELYDAWVALVGEFGPFEQVPTKSRIAFMVRVRFAGVVRLRKDGLVCGFWLKRRIESPRFTTVEHLGRSDWVYRFVVRSEEDLDDEVRSWIREAYKVGRQAHLPA
jgi:Domain of unknown function (DUF5655)